MVSNFVVLLLGAGLAFSMPLDEKMDPTLHRGVDRAAVLTTNANGTTVVTDARGREPVVAVGPIGPSLVEGLNKAPITPTIQETRARGGAMDKPVVEAYDATKQAVANAGEKVKEGYEAGKQKAAEVAGGVKAAADAAAEKTKEGVNDARDWTADKLRSGADKVEARN